VLKTDAERQETDGEWVWISDPEDVWIPARVKVRQGNQLIVILLDNTAVTINASSDEPLWPLRKISLDSIVDDMVMVDSLNQAQMVHLLKQRYMRDEIYTWVGASHSVLVSINPFKQLPIYTATTMAEFAHPSPNKLDSPHTFAIASSAFQHMRSHLQNQAILISGESGAGKTEATKQCFNLLAEIAGSESALEQKILNANPVLEAFGNAKTLRNNNSSRFGRWTAIHFSPSGHIIGALIENYLLEKSRVVHQLKGERNYHIFYQVCTALTLLLLYYYP
jgi:myosin heavy subunit